MADYMRSSSCWNCDNAANEIARLQDEIERLRRRLAALEDWAYDEWPLKYMTPEERESTLLEMEASLEARRG